MQTDLNWDIYEKLTNITKLPLSRLQEGQKKHIMKLYKEKPFAATDETIKSLVKEFEDFNLKRITANSFILHECSLRSRSYLANP